MPKLSDAQRRVLQRMDAGDSVKTSRGVHGEPYYVWIGDDLPVFADGRTVLGLERRRLVTKTYHNVLYPYNNISAITHAGGAALHVCAPCGRAARQTRDGVWLCREGDFALPCEQAATVGEDEQSLR